MTDQPQLITARELADRYEVLLFDAYGVLVRSDGAIPGAVELISHLNAREHDYFVLTNDSSRTIAASTHRYNELGLEIPEDRVVTSGSLLTRYYRENDLQGAATMALGAGDALEYVRRAGGELVDLTEDARPDVVVIGELTPSLYEDIQIILTALLNQLDRGEQVRLVLPNPDLIYPKSADSFGITAGAIAKMYEAILDERYPNKSLRFDRLGKPHHFIYEEGAVRAGVAKDKMIMIGDQLATDVRGALEFGVDAALVQTGLVTARNQDGSWSVTPNYIVSSLWS